MGPQVRESVLSCSNHLYWRVNCHSLLFVILCPFHGFFTYVKIFNHVHMIVPFPVMCSTCSIFSITSNACPVWRNLRENMELLLQLWQEWTCSLSCLLPLLHVQYEGTDGGKNGITVTAAKRVNMLIKFGQNWKSSLTNGYILDNLHVGKKLNYMYHYALQENYAKSSS